MDIEAYAFLQHNKGNLLYCAATAHSTMDYLPKAVNDGVVNSPPSCGVPLAMNSPSSLQGKAKLNSSESNWRDSNGVQSNLCLGLSPASHRKSLMVQFLYHFPSICTKMLSLSSNL